MVPTALVSASYTFGAYSQPVAETGLVADFTDPATQKLATKDATAFAYVSWDATNLYVGFDTTGNTVNGATFVHFYVGLSAGGTLNADDVAVKDGRALPAALHAHYHVYGSDATMGGVDVHTAGGAWTAKTGVGVGYHHINGSTFYELSIPLATFGVTPVNVATELHLLGGVYNAGNATSYGSWPSGNADTGAWTQYQSLLLGVDFAPNDPNNTHQ
jgi:hypothetical protein